MKVLITGASGFIGQVLVAALRDKDFQIVRVTRQISYSDSPDIYTIPDFTKQGVWEYPLQDCDVVIHLAARVHVMHDASENRLQAYLTVNLKDTVNLAKEAAKGGVKRFVFISSIKVNGELTGIEKFSEKNVVNPQDPYAISKWEAEKALRKIEKETGMQVVILRPPLVYGAGVKANFAALLKLINKKIPLPLATIQAKRSLIYVGNLVDAISVCASHPKAAGQTYLVSDGEDVSMPQLIIKTANALNRPSYLWSFPVSIMRFLARLIGKISSIDRLTQSLVIDSAKIQRELDWKPPFTMDEGLKITADWYLETLKKRHN